MQLGDMPGCKDDEEEVRRELAISQGALSRQEDTTESQSRETTNGRMPKGEM